MNAEFYMREAFREALKGSGSVSPNPLVGAILVQGKEIIASGYHHKYGDAHGEADCLKDFESIPEDAVMYCNLEPCCHTDKQTPPCTELLIKKGLKKLVVSNLDPNPEVSGRGIEILKENGVEVEVGLLEKEGAELNRVFFKVMKTGTPFIHIKMAQSLDGRIANEGGDSHWISSEESRRIVHEWRLQYDAVMIGRGTLNADNPSLTIRMGVKNPDDKIPTAIIAGNPENFDWDSKLLKREPIVLYDHTKVNSETFRKCSEAGIRFASNNFELAEMGISSILVEGGAQLASGIVDSCEYDRLSIFISPKLIGNGPTSYGSEVVVPVTQLRQLNLINHELIGQDILIEYS